MIRMYHSQPVIAGIFLVVAGCQHYERRPLDLQHHVAAFSERNLEAEPVLEYARRLATDSGEQPEAFDPKDGLSFREAEAVALHFNPTLRLARVQADVPLENTLAMIEEATAPP